MGILMGEIHFLRDFHASFPNFGKLNNSLVINFRTKLTSSPLNTFRGEDVNLVLSWEFSANQNRGFYMQHLANLI